jgi:predicted site-specific integrase-resolvase
MRQKDAAKALGISERHIRDLIREGKIRACGAMIPIGAVAKIMCG